MLQRVSFKSLRRTSSKRSSTRDPNKNWEKSGNRRPKMCYNVDHAWPYLRDFLKKVSKFKAEKKMRITPSVSLDIDSSADIICPNISPNPNPPNPQTAKNCQSQSCRREKGSTPLEGSFGPLFFLWNINGLHRVLRLVHWSTSDRLPRQQEKKSIIFSLWFNTVAYSGDNPAKTTLRLEVFCPTIISDRSAFQKAVSQSIVKIWFEALLIRWWFLQDSYLQAAGAFIQCCFLFRVPFWGRILPRMGSKAQATRFTTN